MGDIIYGRVVNKTATEAEWLKENRPFLKGETAHVIFPTVDGFIVKTKLATKDGQTFVDMAYNQNIDVRSLGVAKPDVVYPVPTQSAYYNLKSNTTYPNFLDEDGQAIVTPNDGFSSAVWNPAGHWDLITDNLQIDLSPYIKKGTVVTDFKYGDNINVVGKRNVIESAGINPDYGETAQGGGLTTAIVTIYPVLPERDYKITGRASRTAVTFYNEAGNVIPIPPNGGLKWDSGPANGLYTTPPGTYYFIIEGVNATEVSNLTLQLAEGATSVDGVPIYVEVSKSDLDAISARFDDYVKKGEVATEFSYGEDLIKPAAAMNPVQVLFVDHAAINPDSGGVAQSQDFTQAIITLWQVTPGKKYKISGRIATRSVTFYDVNQAVIPIPPNGQTKWNTGPINGVYTAVPGAYYISVECDNISQTALVTIQEMNGVLSVEDVPIYQKSAALVLNEIKEKTYGTFTSGYLDVYDFKGIMPFNILNQFRVSNVISPRGLSLVENGETGLGFGNNQGQFKKYINNQEFILTSTIILDAGGACSVGLQGQRYADHLDLVFWFDGGGSSGKIQFFIRSSQVRTTSDLTMQYAQFDRISFGIRKFYNYYFGFAYNHRTSQWITTVYKYNMNGTDEMIQTVDAYPRFVHFKGALTLEEVNMKVVNKVVKTVFGIDSITSCYHSGGWQFAYQFIAAGDNAAKISTVSGPGYRLADAIAYIQEVLILNPKYYVLYGGTNDKLGNRTVSQFSNDYKTLTDLIYNAGIKPVLLTLPKINGTIPVDYNNVILGIGASKGYKVIRLDQLNLLDSDYQLEGSDRVHPNASGHAKIGNKIKAEAPELFD